MIPFQTTPEQALKAAEYAMKMKQEGIPSLFIGQALVLARVDQGAYELMELWAESDSSNNKDELIADLQELLDDHRELLGVKAGGPIAQGLEIDESEIVAEWAI